MRKFMSRKLKTIFIGMFIVGVVAQDATILYARQSEFLASPGHRQTAQTPKKSQQELLDEYKRMKKNKEEGAAGGSAFRPTPAQVAMTAHTIKNNKNYQKVLAGIGAFFVGCGIVIAKIYRKIMGIPEPEESKGE